MMQPGMFLSQPPIVTMPSNPSPPRRFRSSPRSPRARRANSFMPWRAHADAVGDGDRAEDDRLAAGGVRAGLGFDGELVDVHVARRDHAPGDAMPMMGLAKSSSLKPTGRSMDRAPARLWAIVDDGGELAGVIGGVAHERNSREQTRGGGGGQARLRCGILEVGDSAHPRIRRRALAQMAGVASSVVL